MPEEACAVGQGVQTWEGVTATGLLHLLWLASPALPVGGFSYSEGLEQALEVGLLGSESAIESWLVDQLHLSLGRADLSVVAQAHAAWAVQDLETVRNLNDWMFLTRESSELRQQTRQMGRSLQVWLLQRHPDDGRPAQLGALAPAPSWPVAYALALVLAALPAQAGVLAMAFGWAENLVQAALKTGALGQSAGQRMLGAMVRELPGAAAAAMALPAGAHCTYTPGLAIVSSQHEQQYSRLFRS